MSTRLAWIAGLLCLTSLPLMGQGPSDRRRPETPLVQRLESHEFESEALKREVKVRVQLPDGYEASPTTRYPVIYFLHGLFGSERKWEQRGSHKVVDDLVAQKKLPPVIIVCPNGGNSFYINAKGQDSAKFSDMLVKDLVVWVDGKFRTQAQPAARALLGDSMGGYGAMVNVFRHPGIFGAVAVHEASIFPADLDRLPQWAKQGRGGRSGLLHSLFGNPVDQAYWLDHNLFHLAKTVEKEKLQATSIYFDVGKDDRFGLADPSKEWHELLKEKGIAHQFELREGEHGREFFIENLPESLGFLGKAFSKAEAKPGTAGKDSETPPAPPKQGL